MNQRLVLLIFLSATFSGTWAQMLQIRVIDSKTKTSLPYANIVLKNSTLGTVSNSDGYFTLSVKNENKEDTIFISYIGYKTYRNKLKNILAVKEIALIQDNIGLKEISVYSRDLSAKEIIEKAAEKFEDNHPTPLQRQRLFVHNFTRTPYSEKNKFLIKKSDFPGLNKSLGEELELIMPDQFTDYSDALIDFYTYKGKFKLKPIQAISLEENDQSMILDKLEEKLKVLFEDFEMALKTKDVYYQFKTGILGTKIGDDEPENTIQEEESEDFKDSTIYPISTSSVKSEIKYIIENYSDVESDEMEFLTKTGKYKYELKGISFLDGEPVFEILFKPKSGGLYKGSAYISNVNFAILKLHYEYASGKSTKKFQILGFGHSIRMKKADVIYEQFDSSYFPKYLKVYTEEYTSFERNFSMMKKRKRFLFDEVQNKAKLRAEVFIDIHSNWEILVLERENLSESKFEQITEDRYVNFKKEISYSDELWKDKTIIRPDSTLRAFQRKEF